MRALNPDPPFPKKEQYCKSHSSRTDLKAMMLQNVRLAIFVSLVLVSACNDALHLASSAAAAFEAFVVGGLGFRV